MRHSLAPTPVAGRRLRIADDIGEDPYVRLAKPPFHTTQPWWKLLLAIVEDGVRAFLNYPSMYARWEALPARLKYQVLEDLAWVIGEPVGEGWDFETCMSLMEIDISLARQNLLKRIGLTRDELITRHQHEAVHGFKRKNSRKAA